MQGRKMGHEDATARKRARPAMNQRQSVIPNSRHRSIVGPEIDAADGEVVAWVRGRQSVGDGFSAHMAWFTTPIGVVGTKTENASAANHCVRHAEGGGKRHQTFQSASSVHGCEFYCIFLSWSNWGCFA